jgi:hypothetical protein
MIERALRGDGSGAEFDFSPDGLRLHMRLALWEELPAQGGE